MTVATHAGRPRVGAQLRVLAVASAVVLVAACDSPRQVSDSGFGAYEVSLATLDDEGFAAAWYDTRDGNAEVYVRLLDAEGAPRRADQRLTSTTDQSYEPDIESFDGGIAIAWYDKTAGGALHARLGAWSPELQQRWSLALGDSAGVSRNPLVRATSDALFAAWIERVDTGQEVVRAAWFGFDGVPRGAAVTLGRVGDTTWNLNAALDARGTPFVVYDARVETEADEVFVAELGADGVNLQRLTGDDGFPSKYPDIAIAGSRFAITWFDERDGNEEVYLAQGFLKVDLSADAFVHARRVTDTPGHSIGAYVAWNGARIGLAWSDDTAGAHEVYYQEFDETGEPHAAVRRLTTNATSSLIPAIKAWRDGFALAWNEVTPGGNGAHDPDTRSEVMFSLAR